MDSDSDNDGLSDGDEYHNYGTDPIDNDSDDDGLTDGLEVGISEAVSEYNLPNCENKDGNTFTNCDENWQPDEDPNTTTNATNRDSDGDAIDDGVEEANANGKIEDGEKLWWYSHHE